MTSTPHGRDGKPEAARGLSGADPNMVYTLGQVFVDGQILEQKPYASEAEATPGSWHYDGAAGRLYVNFGTSDPGATSVEITTRRRVFAPHARGLGYIRVVGFVIERCGTQYPTDFWTTATSQQAGAIGTRSGHHWTIRDNVIQDANSIGIDLGNEGMSGDLERGSNGSNSSAGYHVVEDNVIRANGGAGTAGYNARYLTFVGNVVEYNNSLRMTGTKRWGSAGIKLHTPKGSLIARNLVRENYGYWGIWLDGGGGVGTRVTRNLVIGHGAGVEQEIGNQALDDVVIDNNVFIDNTYGISTRDSGGFTALNNLILGGKYGFHQTVDPSRSGAGSSWSAAHHRIENNMVIGATNIATINPPDTALTADRILDANVYQASATGTLFTVVGQSRMTFAQWQAAWVGYNGSAGAEQNSHLVAASSYAFDESTLTLSIHLAFEPASYPGLAHPALDYDFLGDAIPSSGARPGALQRLVAGDNALALWQGISPAPNAP